MKRKFFENKIKPLICKKSSKNSKKKKIYEYEKNISTLLKNMKISDSSDGKSSSPEKYVPFKSFGLDSSMRNKFLRCNLRTYSSYTRSKSLNVYKKAESKCIRFISIGSYLQGKVSCTPNYAKSKMKKLHSFSTENNEHVIFSERKSMFGIQSNFKLDKFKHSLKKFGGKFGEIPNFKLKSTYLDMISEKCQMMECDNHNGKFSCLNFPLNDIPATLSFNTELLENIKTIIFPEQLNLYVTMFISEDKLVSSCKKFCYMSVITSRGKLPTLHTVSDHFNESKIMNQQVKSTGMEVCYSSPTDSPLTLAERFEIVKTTITQILWLDIVIESYQSAFKQCSYDSIALKGIDNMKLRSARLLNRCTVLLKKMYRSKELYEQLKTYRKKDPNERIFSNASTLEKMYRITKRNCKRKKKVKDVQTPKRSKLLDDCIQRASSTSRFPSKCKVTSSMSNGSEKARNCETSRTKERVKSTDVYCEYSNAAEKDLRRISILVDPVEEELKKILLNLPPLDEALKTPEPFEKKDVDFSNLTDIVHYDMGNGRSLVILPYVDI